VAGPTGTPGATPTTASASIGVTGGTVGVGGAQVTIPAGALGTKQTITVSPGTVATVPPNFTLAGPPIEFRPDGLQFAQPVTITLPLQSPRPKGPLAVLVVSANGQEQVIRVQTVANGFVTVQTTHFSTYAAVVPTVSGSSTPGVWDSTDWDNGTWQ
jgi:hypothetical protein